MKADYDRVNKLLTDTVTLLCKNGLTYDHELKVQGLLAITLDGMDVLVVHINETFEVPGTSAPGNASNNEKPWPTTSSDKLPTRKRVTTETTSRTNEEVVDLTRLVKTPVCSGLQSHGRGLQPRFITPASAPVNNTHMPLRATTGPGQSRGQGIPVGTCWAVGSGLMDVPGMNRFSSAPPQSSGFMGRDETLLASRNVHSAVDYWPQTRQQFGFSGHSVINRPPVPRDLTMCSLPWTYSSISVPNVAQGIHPRATAMRYQGQRGLERFPLSAVDVAQFSSGNTADDHYRVPPYFTKQRSVAGPTVPMSSSERHTSLDENQSRSSIRSKESTSLQANVSGLTSDLTKFSNVPHRVTSLGYTEDSSGGSVGSTGTLAHTISYIPHTVSVPQPPNIKSCCSPTKESNNNRPIAFSDSNILNTGTTDTIIPLGNRADQLIEPFPGLLDSTRLDSTIMPTCGIVLIEPDGMDDFNDEAATLKPNDDSIVAKLPVNSTPESENRKLEIMHEMIQGEIQELTRNATPTDIHVPTGGNNNSAHQNVSLVHCNFEVGHSVANSGFRNCISDVEITGSIEAVVPQPIVTADEQIVSMNLGQIEVAKTKRNASEVNATETAGGVVEVRLSDKNSTSWTAADEIHNAGETMSCPGGAVDQLSVTSECLATTKDQLSLRTCCLHETPDSSIIASDNTSTLSPRPCLVVSSNSSGLTQIPNETEVTLYSASDNSSLCSVMSLDETGATFACRVKGCPMICKIASDLAFHYCYQHPEVIAQDLLSNVEMPLAKKIRSQKHPKAGNLYAKSLRPSTASKREYSEQTRGLRDLSLVRPCVSVNKYVRHRPKNFSCCFVECKKKYSSLKRLLNHEKNRHPECPSNVGQINSQMNCSDVSDSNGVDACRADVSRKTLLIADLDKNAEQKNSKLPEAGAEFSQVVRFAGKSSDEENRINHVSIVGRSGECPSVAGYGKVAVQNNFTIPEGGTELSEIPCLTPELAYNVYSME